MGCNCKGRTEPIINDEIGSKVVLKVLVEGNVPSYDEKRTLYLYYDFLFQTKTSISCSGCFENIKTKLLERYNQKK
jgi:hypothetical protein